MNWKPMTKAQDRSKLGLRTAAAWLGFLLVLSWVGLAEAGGAEAPDGEATSGKPTSGEEIPPPGPLEIASSFYPLHILTLNVTAGAEGVSATCLTPPAIGCPHNIGLSPGDVRRLKRSRALILNGLGLDSFFEDAQLGGPDVLRIVASRPIARRLLIPELSEGEPGAVAETHSDPPELGAAEHYNPHVWASPFHAAEMAGAIADGLAEIDPPNAALYTGNAERYALRLTELGERTRRALEWLSDRRVVTLHDSLAYWARDMGLEIVGAAEVGASGGATARSLARLISSLKDRPPAAVLVDTQYSDRLGRALSRELGCALVRLSSASTGAIALDAYEKIQIDNLEEIERWRDHAAGTGD